MKFEPSSHIFRSLVHIVHARDYAKAGLIKRAIKHRETAHHHFTQHIGELTSQHKHDEVKQITDHMTPYFKKIDEIIHHAKKTPKPKKKVFKSDRSIEGLEKAILVSVPGTPPKKYQTKQMVDRQPGRDSRYDYKPFHELNHDDQVKATHAFQDKDMRNHHYPVDKKTGEFVHGATRWLQSTKAPQATPGDHKSVVAPEHRVGASVRIQAEGHPLNGKLGMVKMPNPNMKGKIAVQYGIKDHEIEFLEPHQVALNDKNKSKELSDLVDRSKSVLKSIRKEPE